MADNTLTIRLNGAFQKMLTFVDRQIKQVVKGGVPVLVQKIGVFLSKGLLVFLAIPVVAVLRVLRPFVTVRLTGLDISRIGGIYNADWYLSERCDGLHGKPYFDIFYFQSAEGVICNQQWMKMWRRVLPIFPYGKLAAMVNRGSKIFPGHQAHVLSTGTLSPRTIITRQETLGNILKCKKAHLTFTSAEETYGREILEREFGISEEKPFICFHARDSAYLNAVFPDRVWSYHDYRDSSIHNYVPAADELVRRGYCAVRMGSIVKENLEGSNPGIIDYACSGKRLDFLDIYLGAKSTFFICSDVGIAIVPEVFRRPIVYTNWTPLKRISPWVIDGLFIFKKFYSRKEKRLLTFREIIHSPLGEFGSTEAFVHEDIELLESTPEEIAEAAVEMDDRLKGKWKTTKEDEELQQRFWALFGSHKLKSPGVRIGAEFLRHHQELLN